jgi:hypothetical protein
MQAPSHFKIQTDFTRKSHREFVCIFIIIVTGFTPSKKQERANMATPPTHTIPRQVLPVSTISSNLAAGIYRFPPVEFLSSPSLPVRSTASETALSFLLGCLSSLLYRNGARLLHLFSSLASLPYVPLLSMEPILRPGAVFFLEWPTWARLAIVSWVSFLERRCC